MNNQPGIEAVIATIENHPGMESLRKFGAKLQDSPLSRADLALFFASTGEFFKEIPSGILALGLRLCDSYRDSDRFGAVRKAAEILYSAVDEFGLHRLDRGIQESHHQLFLEGAEAWGLRSADLEAPGNILPSASAMADLTYIGYRERSLGESLGFHLASEITSDVEFNLCYRGLLAFADHYGIKGPKDRKLEFYRIHTLVEPMHGKTSLQAIEDHAARHPSIWPEIHAGAAAFMIGYGALFADLTTAIGVDPLRGIAKAA